MAKTKTTTKPKTMPKTKTKTKTKTNTKTKTKLNQLLRCTVLGYRANRHTVSWTRQTAASPTPVALTFNEKVIRSYCILIIDANL